MDRLLRDLSINVTEMFRDPTYFKAIRDEVAKSGKSEAEVLKPRVAILDDVITSGESALIAAGWAGHARIFRASVLSLREQPYVEAAISVGTPSGPTKSAKLSPSPARRVFSSSRTLALMNSVTASGPRRQTLPSLTVSVTGNGSVRSQPAGIDCGSTCTASFGDGASGSLR